MYDYLVDQAQARRERILTEVEQDRLIKEARKARNDFIYTALEQRLQQGWLKLGGIFRALRGFKYLGRNSPKAIKRTTL
jgi:hypothetical protein